MTTGGAKRRYGGVAPDPQGETSSAQGPRFDDPDPHVRAGTSDDEGSQDVPQKPTGAERELTDEQLIDVWKKTTAGVRDGTISPFDNKEAFLADAKKRFGL